MSKTSSRAAGEGGCPRLALPASPFHLQEAGGWSHLCPWRYNTPGSKASLLSPIPGPDRGLPTPDSAPEPPSRVEGLGTPLIRAQPPPGEGVRPGGGGALLPEVPGPPAVVTGLGRAAAAQGAGHGGGDGGGAAGGGGRC